MSSSLPRSLATTTSWTSTTKTTLSGSTRRLLMVAAILATIALPGMMNHPDTVSTVVEAMPMPMPMPMS
ncbi:hypothetical protein BGX29_011141, partial [Mortierella sp. GBA35]